MPDLWERFRDEVLRIWEPADLLMQEGGSTDAGYRQILYNHKPVPAVVPDRETPKFAIESIWRIGQLMHVAVRMRVTEWVELGRDPIDAKQTIKLFFAQLDGLPNPNLYKDYLCDEEAGLLVSAAGDSEKSAEWKRLISHRRNLTAAIVIAQYKLMLLRRELKEQLADPPAETELEAAADESTVVAADKVRATTVQDPPAGTSAGGEARDPDQSDARMIVLRALLWARHFASDGQAIDSAEFFSLGEIEHQIHSSRPGKTIEGWSPSSISRLFRRLFGKCGYAEYKRLASSRNGLESLRKKLDPEKFRDRFQHEFMDGPFHGLPGDETDETDETFS